MYFIQSIWGMSGQPIKEECKDFVDKCVLRGEWDKIKAEHFDKFIKGKHITWQQWLIVMAVERALVYGDNKISVVAGHGVGKSSVLSMLIIWYLFCHLDAQIGATAPTSEQIHDVLWKEVSLWMGKMRPELKDLFEWQTGYIRVKERPETWFARARTARKEAPEAIAGLHADHVLIIVDESSGVPDEIYRAAEGSMTGPNVLVILIGNGTRPEGYFYDTHHSDKSNWQTFSFNSEDSPIVEEGYIERMAAKHGRESDEFRIRVVGGFPSSEQMDDKGWIPLLSESDIRIGPANQEWVGRRVMAVDPSGEGDDKTVWAVRDNFHSRVVATEAVSTPKSIALRTLDLVRELNIDWSDVIVDNLGEGANVSRELLLLNHEANVTAMNWGEEADDPEVYLNKRAEACFRGREWLIKGGTVVGDELKRDILSYNYRNTLSDKKQILDKPRLRKKLGRSPDRGDAFFMTFYYMGDLKSSGQIGSVSYQTTRNDLHSAI